MLRLCCLLKMFQLRFRLLAAAAKISAAFRSVIDTFDKDLIHGCYPTKFKISFMWLRRQILSLIKPPLNWICSALPSVIPTGLLV